MTSKEYSKISEKNKKMDFKFNEVNSQLAEKICAKYEYKKSALIPLLDLAQRQNNNWLSSDVIKYISYYIDLPYIRVYEVASFYTMFNLNPVGKYHIQVCGTTPCWLRGAETVKKFFEKKLNVSCGDTTSDKLFTLSEVECLGACTNAPVAQINDDYYENLDEDKIDKILRQCQNREI